MEAANRSKNVPFKDFDEPYKEPVSDRKLFLSERLNRFERWQHDNGNPTATTQPIFDAIQDLQQLAEPLWDTHTDYYTSEQIDILGRCHFLASDIQDKLVQFAAKQND